MSRLEFLFLGLFLVCTGAANISGGEKSSANNSLTVKKCEDFQITGNGSDIQWIKTQWNPLQKLDAGGAEDKSRFKILWSGTGIYVFMEGEDQRISTRFNKDFDNLFMGDVFEIFFHPDPKIPLYLEYEINQLNKELVLLIPNLNGKALGWTPWHYENGRCVAKKVHIEGGTAAMGGAIKSWSAELFFPFGLFDPLGNVPPVSGTIWKANFYRLDYDTGKMIKWAWTPINKSFHEFEKYGSIRFE